MIALFRKVIIAIVVHFMNLLRGSLNYSANKRTLLGAATVPRGRIRLN